MTWYWWLIAIPAGITSNYFGWRSTFGKDGWPFNWRALVFALYYRRWYWKELEKGIRE